MPKFKINISSNDNVPKIEWWERFKRRYLRYLNLLPLKNWTAGPFLSFLLSFSFSLSLCEIALFLHHESPLQADLPIITSLSCQSTVGQPCWRGNVCLETLLLKEGERRDTLTKANFSIDFRCHKYRPNRKTKRIRLEQQRASRRRRISNRHCGKEILCHFIADDHCVWNWR